MDLTERVSRILRFGGWRAKAATLVVAAVALFVAGCSDDDPGPKRENVAESPPKAAKGVPEEEPVARVASQIEPSVVQVNVRGERETPQGSQEQEGIGSGVIYREDGYIITNDHVVEGASQVNVAFADGETMRGEVVGSDPRTDLAAIKVERGDLPAASFGDESPVVGQLAVAVGSPSGFESTVTSGVVSGLNREIPPEYTGGRQQVSLVDLIQTDAAISPGSSGGALASRDGEIIGISVAYLPQTQSGAPVEGIGFAIPATTATSVADQLIESGEVSTPYMGVYPVDISARDARELDLEGVEDGGAGVEEVTPGSPADDAGIRARDVIVSLDGEKIEGSGDLYGALHDYEPGDTVELDAVRSGRERSFEVTLGELPSS